MGGGEERETERERGRLGDGWGGGGGFREGRRVSGLLQT